MTLFAEMSLCGAFIVPKFYKCRLSYVLQVTHSAYLPYTIILVHMRHPKDTLFSHILPAPARNPHPRLTIWKTKKFLAYYSHLYFNYTHTGALSQVASSSVPSRRLLMQHFFFKLFRTLSFRKVAVTPDRSWLRPIF